MVKKSERTGSTFLEPTARELSSAAAPFPSLLRLLESTFGFPWKPFPPLPFHLFESWNFFSDSSHKQLNFERREESVLNLAGECSKAVTCGVKYW